MSKILGDLMALADNFADSAYHRRSSMPQDREDLRQAIRAALVDLDARTYAVVNRLAGEDAT